MNEHNYMMLEQVRLLFKIQTGFIEIKQVTGTENRGFYVATGIVQRRDVSIIYSVILYSSYNLITKDTSCYDTSISRLRLGAGQET